MPMIEIPASHYAGLPGDVRIHVETVNAVLREHGADEALDVHESLEPIEFPFMVVAVDDRGPVERFAVLEHRAL